MYQFSNQYLSQTTEEPTVTLGNQGEHSHIRIQTAKHGREQFYPSLRKDQSGHNSHIQLERQLQICHSEMQMLKEQVELDQKEKIALEETILALKKQANAALSQNQKLFQQTQKQRHLIQNLKIDNHSMQMQINRFKSQKKVFINNLSNIDTLKRDVTSQLADKHQMIEQLSNSLRKLERTHSQCRIKFQEYDRIASETDIERQELKEELKSALQKYFSNQSHLSKLEYSLKEVNELNKEMKDRIYNLEEERRELCLRLGYEGTGTNERRLSDSMRSNYPFNEKSMVQIKSYMAQIGNILEIKRDDATHYKKNYQKLRFSIRNLEQHL